MVLIALLLITRAQAWEQSVNPDGQETAWIAMPGPAAFDSSGAPDGLDDAAQERAIEDAFLAWNDVPGGDIAFSLTSPGTAGANPVRWERDWPWDSDILAMTSTWSDPTGAIYAFEVAINARDPHWSLVGDRDGMDLQNAIAHEAGHALGLDHPADQPDATMYATAMSGEQLKRDLHWDDEDGIRALYPSGDGSMPTEIDVMELLGCTNVAALPGLLPALAGIFALRRGRRTS